MWDPDFDSNNYTRWTKKGLIIRLRQSWFAFPDTLSMPDFSRYIANKIYSPSYISLHSALSYYGMIPESITDITSVTTRKTASFENKFGHYSYRNVKTSLFFGYTLKTLPDGRAYLLATPEKALLDLLYLLPIYNTEEDMQDLRLDETFIEDDLSKEKFSEYLKIFDSKTLYNRAKTLFKAYGI